MTPRRGLATTLTVGGVGAAAALYAASRTWLVDLVEQVAPLPPKVTELTGSDLAPAVTGLALLALAGLAALIAARGWGRRLVGALIALSGLGVCGSAISAMSTAVVGGWIALAVAAGMAITAAGVFALIASAGWPGLGARYEAGGRSDRRAEQRDGGPWDAIDRGVDPTLPTS